MKNLFKILIMLFISLNASCQILPLKTPNFDCLNGAYKKDLDNIFPYLSGTWKGVVNNKEYTFQFVSFPHQLVEFSNGDYFYEDQLKCKFKVVDLSNNQILYNDLMITNFDDYKIIFTGYGINLGYTFCFYDNQINCNNKVSFRILKNHNNLTQVTYRAFEYEEYRRTIDCPYANQSDIPIFLPTSDLILTKQ